jgi:hypothetical protein
MIKLGILHYTTNIYALELEKRLEFIFIKSIFKRINQQTKFNFIIFKDATASALQLLTLILNVKNKDLTQIFNLNSTNT